MKHLIIGMGEVGKALHWVLRDKYDKVVGIDKDDLGYGKVFDCIHICYPYSESFIESVKSYDYQFMKIGGLCIIHSTVPIGTSHLCSVNRNGANIYDAVHSPIRGQHPNLERGIRTFTKYFGGKRSEEASDIFTGLISSRVSVPDARTTEALKLWDTAQYAWNVILEKEIHKWCEENNVDFKMVYTHANNSYNNGYGRLGRGIEDDESEYLKYVLQHMPGGIGGHCLIPNALLLDTFITNTILNKNNEYKAEEDDNGDN